VGKRSSAERVLSRLEHFGIKLGLETTRAVLAEMGDPQERFSSVLVAGTNGKGSVAALLASIASAADYKTGLFTSPHLESVGERIRVDGRSMDEERLGELLQEISEVAETVNGSPATYFESLFVAACLWFADQEVDLVVLEVGLGGRLDATNVSEPVVSVITEIALEHQEQLGSTVESIAREKAGIMRPSRPVVVGAREESGLEQLKRSADEVGAGWYWVPERAKIEDVVEETDWSQRLRIQTPSQEYETRLRLPGRHQQRNLLAAVVAAEVLADSGWVRIDRRAVEEGVESCSWPGRLERIEIPGRELILLDAAHNPSAARALSTFLEERLANYCLLFGVLGDKDASEMLETLLSGAASAVLTRPDSPRAHDPEELLDLLPATLRADIVDDPQLALDAALASGSPVVACGSIYLIGEVRRLLRRRFGAPPVT
jgi:dihydrofolate synthase/folylpolyglutamate synthase